MEQYAEHSKLNQLLGECANRPYSLCAFTLKIEFVQGQMPIVMHSLQVAAIWGRYSTLWQWLSDVSILGRPPNNCKMILADIIDALFVDDYSPGNLGFKSWSLVLKPSGLLQVQCNVLIESLIKYPDTCPVGAGTLRFCLLWNRKLPHDRCERMARDGIILIAGRFKVRLPGMVTHLHRVNTILCENCFTEQQPNHVNPVLRWLQERYALLPPRLRFVFT